MILRREQEFTMSDINTVEHADIVDDVVLTRDETLILKQFAGELLAKVEAKRKRDEWNEHARKMNRRGSDPVYKPPEPTAPPQPARSVGLTQIQPDDDWIKNSHRWARR